MKFITCQQYIEYLKSKESTQLKEKDVVYQFTKSKEKPYHKEPAKMFRNVLSQKKEMVNFLNQFLNLKEKIKKEQIIPYHANFVTQSDIIYRLKDKPIYFLVEHQSTMKQDMHSRIWEYIGEIMRKESIVQKTYLRKDKVYPVVVPIIIYTGAEKWKLPTSFAQNQYQSSQYKRYQSNLEYNLIDVQDYSMEELLEKNTLLASIMIIEKCKIKKEELNHRKEM